MTADDEVHKAERTHNETGSTTPGKRSSRIHTANVLANALGDGSERKRSKKKANSLSATKSMPEVQPGPSPPAHRPGRQRQESPGARPGDAAAQMNAHLLSVPEISGQRKRCIITFWESLPVRYRRLLLERDQQNPDAEDHVVRKVAAEVEAYQALLCELDLQRHARRESEGRDVSGVESFVTLDGDLDIRPLRDRLTEIKGALPLVVRLLEAMLIPATRDQELKRCRTAQRNGSERPVLTGSEKSITMLGGAELENHIEGLEAGSNRALCHVMDVVVSSRGGGAASIVCEGAVEDSLWAKWFGGTLIDMDRRRKFSLGISRDSVARIEKEASKLYKLAFPRIVVERIIQTKS